MAVSTAVRVEDSGTSYLLSFPRLHFDTNEVQVFVVKSFILLPGLSLLAPSPLFAAQLLFLVLIFVDDKAGSLLRLY